MSAEEIRRQTARLVTVDTGVHLDPRTITLIRPQRRTSPYRRNGKQYFAMVVIETRAGKTLTIPQTDYQGALAVRDALWDKVDGPRRKPDKPSRLKQLPNGIAVDPFCITLLNRIENYMVKEKGAVIYRAALEITTWGKQQFVIPFQKIEQADKLSNTLCLLANNKPVAQKSTNFEGRPMPGDANWEGYAALA